MNIDELKALLVQAKDNPDVLEADRDPVDELLLGIIKIEKKHLYGLESTSTQKRRDEIKNYLDKHLKSALGE